jgi:hypothetical protein
MSWDKAAMREDRRQRYFDAILWAVSEAGGLLTRKRLLTLVAKDVGGGGGHGVARGPNSRRDGPREVPHSTGRAAVPE